MIHSQQFDQSVFTKLNNFKFSIYTNRNCIFNNKKMKNISQQDCTKSTALLKQIITIRIFFFIWLIIKFLLLIIIYKASLIQYTILYKYNYNYNILLYI
jgi:hypothetical protein